MEGFILARKQFAVEGGEVACFTQLPPMFFKFLACSVSHATLGKMLYHIKLQGEAHFVKLVESLLN